MTACVNKKHSKKVSAVVTATLVGALSIGAPAVAMASTDISLQTVEAADAFSAGTVTANVYHGTDKVSDVNGIVFNSVKAVTVKPVSVAVDGTTVPVSDTSVYKVKYYKADDKGNPTGDAIAAPSAAGKYVAVVEATSGTYKGGQAKFAFAIAAKDITGAKPVLLKADGTAGAEITDDNVTYTASEKKIGFKLDDDLLVEGVDYSVKYYKAGGDLTDANAISGLPVDADSYVAVVTGLGNYGGSSAKLQTTIKINALDLSQCTFEAITTTSESAPKNPTAVIVDGVRIDDEALLDQISLTFKTGDAGDAQGKIYFGENGKYTFTAAPSVTTANFAKKADGTYETKTLDVVKVGALANWTYNGKAWPTEWKTVLSNLVDYPKWSSSNVKATGKDSKHVLTTSRVAYDANGTDVTNTIDWGGTPGVYTVIYTVDPTTNDYAFGGSSTVKLTVTQGAIDADASATVVYDDDVVTSVSVDYTGSAIKADNFTVTVKDSDGKKLTQGKDYTVKLVNSKGQTVTEAVNAGEYKLIIESTKYELSGTTEVPVTINKVDLSSVRSNLGKLSGGVAYIEQPSAGITLSGLELQYQTKVDANNDGELDWAKLPNCDDSHVKVEMYNETKEEWVDVTTNKDKFKDEGDYRITVFPATENEAENYVYASDNKTVVEYKVVAAKKFVFKDVTLAHWAFEAVANVSSYDNDVTTGYMNGYNGTKIFGVDDQITRGQVACVLFNMAKDGGDADVDNGWYNELEGWKSFGDVNGKEYYGEAIAWAKNAGVVNGYGDGTFRPDAPVTREEFACMLANYAKKFQDFEAVDDVDEALSEFSDGSSVTSWAKDSVAWAVENEIMGNSGLIMPTSDITRGMTAGMIYNYSPIK